MSEETTRNVLAELDAFEAAAFRVGQLIRRLRAENPGLQVNAMQPTVWVLANANGPSVHADLEIECDSVDAVHAWAAVLNVEAAVTVDTRHPYGRGVAKAVVADIAVKVSGSRFLTGDEHAAWQAGQDQATVTASTGGGE